MCNQNYNRLVAGCENSSLNLVFQIMPENIGNQFLIDSEHYTIYTPATLRLYSARAASSLSRAVVSPGTLCEGCM